jgi:hypothetical protein
MVGELQGPGDVLLDQEQGGAGPGQPLDKGEDVVDDLGGQPHRHFVEEDDTGFRHVGPGQGEHLLLPTGKGPGALPHPLAENREGLRRAGDRIIGRPLGEGGQVLPHAQSREDRPAFGDVADTELPAPEGWSRRDVLPVHRHPPGAGPEFTRGHTHHRGLPRPVGPEQRHHRRVGHRQADVTQHRRLAIPADHGLEREHQTASSLEPR